MTIRPEIRSDILAEIEAARAQVLTASPEDRQRIQLSAWHRAIGPFPGATMSDHEFVIYSLAALTLELEKVA